MRTENYKREYCQCCGVDFTNRAYAHKIGHQNHTGDHTVSIYASRYKDAKKEKNTRYAFMDMIGLNSYAHASYQVSMEILDCLIQAFRSGYKDSFNDYKLTKNVELANFLEKNRDNVKKEYNEIIQNEIDSRQAEIRNIERQLIK
jgi:hypothetical protein